MPHHKSAIKRVRQNPKRTAKNRGDRSAFRTAMKKMDGLLVEGNVENALAQVQPTLQLIGKTAKKGLIHKNKAARHASRLAKKITALKAKKA